MYDVMSSRCVIDTRVLRAPTLLLGAAADVRSCNGVRDNTYVCVVAYRHWITMFNCGRAAAVASLQHTLSRTHVALGGYVVVCLKSRVRVVTLLREMTLTPSVQMRWLQLQRIRLRMPVDRRAATC